MILGEIGVIPSRHLEVVQLGLVAVMHFVAELAESQAEVDVLETVDECIIETSSFLERLATEEGATGSHDRITP